jgi:regulator of protease activity HflC (stomatin/prohibitin superfamily)
MIVGIVVAIAVFAALLVAGSSIKIIREYQRIVLFRLGRAIGTRGPGMVFIMPGIDRTSWVDLREQYLEIPSQTAITKDNAPISIDFIIFYKVIDPEMSVLQVQNFAGAALNVAATTLRSVVGDMALDDVLSKREEMNASLRVRLDEVTERWGVKVTNVEVREVNPPPGVLEAMTRQMSAERTRRAAITEAEGKKSATILAAEGERQSAIAIAEGRKQAAILSAEADRRSAVLKAEGYSGGLQAILDVAKTLDEKTMLLQYLDTLKQVGTSPSTKFVVPLEVAGLLRGLGGFLPQASPATNVPAPPSPLGTGTPGAGTTAAGTTGGAPPDRGAANGGPVPAQPAPHAVPAGNGAAPGTSTQARDGSARDLDDALAADLDADLAAQLEGAAPAGDSAPGVELDALAASVVLPSLGPLDHPFGEAVLDEEPPTA